MRRLAVVTSHPIQNQAPLFRALAGECDLTVFFCHRQTAQEQGDAGFGQSFDWDVPLLEGYRHEWLENVAQDPGVSGFFGCDTPGIGDRLDRGRFDACLVSGWHLKSYLQAIRACRSLGIRLLVRGDSHLRGRRTTFVRVAKYLPYRWMLSRVDAHLYVGRANRDYLRHYGVADARLHFAPHFVENERFASGAATARRDGTARELRRSWGAADDDVVFGFVGKLIAIKRVHDFVDAIAAASKNDRTVRGVIVGAGPEQVALRARASAAGAPVAFAGFVNQSALPACYGALDAIVLPSGEESWGLVVNEAMAAGLPAIVSDAVGAGDDLVDEDVTGSTFEAGNVATLTERIGRMASALRSRRQDISRAVERKIGAYSCESAVAGVLSAMKRGSGVQAPHSVEAGTRA